MIKEKDNKWKQISHSSSQTSLHGTGTRVQIQLIPTILTILLIN